MPNVTKQLKLVLSFYCVLHFFAISAFGQTTKVSELLAQLNSSNPDSVQIAIMRKLSAAYTSVDPIKKFYYANQYRLLAEKNKLDSTVSDAYQDMGIAYAIRTNLDSALFYFKLGQDKARASNYARGLARSFVNFGYTYDRLDRKKEALQNYEEALKIFRNIKFDKGINQTVTNLASLYFDLQQYKTAKVYFQQVYDNLKDNPKDEIAMGNVLFSLAACSRKLGNAKEAMEGYQKSLAIRERIGDLNGIALSNWGIGQLYVDKKQYQLSLPYLDIALTNNRILKNAYHECAVLNTLGDAQLGLEDYSAAEKTAKLAMLRARETKSKVPLATALNLLSRVSVAQKKFEEALKYKSEYTAVSDSLHINQTVNDVVVEDLNRVNLDNAKLEKSNKEIVARNTEYLTAISIITALLILLVILLVLYYKRNTEKKNANNLLQKQTQVIAETNEELNSLNEELTTQMDIVSSQNIELEKLNSLKNKFFSIVSHDLRGPINTLKMLLEFYREADLNEEELKKTLARLEDSIYTTASFLDNLLEWSRSQLDGMVVNPDTVNLRMMISDNITLMNAQIKLKSIHVENEVAEQTTIFADPNMINTVIRNLLSNAIKFCATGDRIFFAAKVEGNEVICTISDNGPGINDIDKENLFNLAHTISTGTSGEKGYHIGLLLCKDMLSQNHGKIEVESEIDKGTTFYITLPVGVSAKA